MSGYYYYYLPGKALKNIQHSTSELKGGRCENSMGLDLSTFMNSTEAVGMDSDDLVSTLNVI